MDKTTRSIRDMLANPRPIAGGDGTDDLTEESVRELTPEQLAAAEENLVAEFDQATTGENPDVARGRELAQAIQLVRGETERRETEAAEQQAQLEELRGQVHTGDQPAAEGDPDGGDGGEQPAESGDGGDGGEQPAGDPAQPGTDVDVNVQTGGDPAQPEQIAASAGRPSIAEIARRTPASHDPAPAEDPSPRVTIVAAADVPGVSAGSEMDARQVGEAFEEKTFALMGSKGGAFPVARFRVEYPEDRVLVASGTVSGAESVNTERVRAMVEHAERMAREDLAAITAAGGICAPVDVNYDLTVVAQADRPVRDALVRFGADRGGIRYTTPPALGQLSAGIAHWTEENDRNPGDAAVPAADRLAAKPCVTITCGAEQQVLVEAITMCIKVGNFQRRFFSEQFDAWYQLALAAHARYAESRLLDKISAGSVQVGDEPVVLGLARDLFDTYARLAAGYRSRNRTSEDAMLDLLLPAWVRSALIVDLYKQQPGDDAFGQAAGMINRAFNELRLNPVWYLDSETADAGEVSQIWPAQGAGLGLGWKGEAIGYLFHPGAWMHLDGGTLDLGIDIRDAALISTNDVKAFMETFESAAFNGIESLKVTTVVNVAGSHSGPQDLIV